MSDGPLIFPGPETVNDIAFHQGDIPIREASDQVTCENGHVFGKMKRTLMAVAHSDPREFPLADFVEWTGQRPPSVPPVEGYQCKCGGLFILHGDPRKPLGDPSHHHWADKSEWPNHVYEYEIYEPGFAPGTGKGAHFTKTLVAIDGKPV